MNTSASSGLPPCRLCGGDGEVWFTKRESTFFRCTRCGFGYTEVRQNPNLPDTLDEYEAAYREYLERGAGDTSDFMDLLRQLGDLVDLDDSVWLDVGCGTGDFVKFLNEQGVTARGLEPSRPLFDHYLEGAGPFKNCTLEEIEEKEVREYDIISLLDVLEHVEFPVATIQNAHRVLKTGGWLIIEIPAVDGLLPRVLGRAWPHYNSYHLSYFSSELLADTVCDKGFRLHRGWWRGRHFSISYLLQYLIDFGLGREGGLRPAGGIFDRPVYLNFFDVYCAVFQKINP